MATNRLKRKAEELNVQGLNENFCSYGTPLPSIAHKDKNEYVPVWQQEVRDEKGRRRLHGAFTGGFSAGYFNTVGSKEGWTPSTFKSSRATKEAAGQNASDASTQQRTMQRPEDFMDEEDLVELRATESLKPSASFDAPQTASATGFDALLGDMVKPRSDAIGEKLMKRMGWREGQGAGPRVSAQARQRTADELGLGSFYTSSANDDDEALKHSFAPLDRPLVAYAAKDNTFGLGYIAGMTLNQLQAETSQIVKGKAKASDITLPRGGAFGISALEELDEDDADIYAMRPQDEEVLRTATEERRRKGPQLLGQSEVQADRRRERATRPASAGQRFKDDSIVIAGFVLAVQPVPVDTWFEPPDVPQEWQPRPERVLGAAIPQASKQTVKNADERAHALGEEPIKGPARSVFDFISAKDRERLASFRSAAPNGSTSEAIPTGPEPSNEVEVPSVDVVTAKAALGGYMPYQDDIPRQTRYRLFLESAAGLRKDVRFVPLANMTVAQLNRELQDFARSAKIFKPMSVMMASRFTAGSALSTTFAADQPEPGLRKVTALSEDAQPGEAETPKYIEENLTPAQNAARAGMFGTLTRSETPFYPNRLLCKRFNVPDPHPEGPHVNVKDDSKDVLNKAAMDRIVRSSNLDEATIEAMTAVQPMADKPAASKAQPSGPRDLATVGIGDDENQGRDTLTYERPSMDIFKAIFADSDDDDDEKEETLAVEHADAPADPSAVQPETALAEDAVMMDAAATVASVPRFDPEHGIRYEAPKPGHVEQVDLSSFKPTFVARPTAAKTESTKTKIKKQKKPHKSVLSFDVEDGADDADADLKSGRKAKPNPNLGPAVKRRVKEEEVWVEKNPVGSRQIRPTAVDFI
ncbi:uncharacterized protein L969DRAFT_293484 [Mixia osmundae IAM 14324]|uniref:uncharacterized protein n=1 Tax=Mixia osmundae (strain CBS 9802 / IAM 14324 / JCM 22182 / KY 12970) TaxID=764103 RepID=UPI0004A54C1A|nr:uncharacterized protein L969DRAFT_293484 [Mixia osmundae IAM 14324]KEI41231.1 hypothetical protein L969DRAFT_293484 [Mixia osmundae IAM 14324]